MVGRVELHSPQSVAASMRFLLAIVCALIFGAGAMYFGLRVFAPVRTELTFPAPDPDPKFAKALRPGQSFGCDPLADANVFDDRFTHNATIWASQDASKVAVQISADGKRLLLM